MRWQSVAILLLLILSSAGWWQVWRPGAPTGADFARRRLAFLEEENRRLASALAKQQSAQQAGREGLQRAEIEKKVSALRGLPFTQPVRYREIPRSELPTILRQKLVQQVPDTEFEANGTALAALGLLPSKLDLKQTYLSLLGEQVGAFYDQHTRELFTFSGQSLDNSQNRVILAHELTHALEDQHFHLANLPLERKGNDDRAQAASALVEGDATLVMNQYLLGNLSASVIQDSLAGALTTDVRQLAAAPRYLREGLVFPYLKGQVFCQALYDKGGWPELARAFRRPPASTAEILHPERFLAVPRWQPVEISLPETTVRGEKPTADNVLGEFGVRQLLAVWSSGTGDEGLAAAWAGDRYVVFGDARHASYLWRSVWATADTAHRVAEAARAGWSKRYGVTLQAGGDAPPKATIAAQNVFRAHGPNGRELKIVQAEKTLAMIDARDEGWMEALSALGNSASFDKEANP